MESDAFESYARIMIEPNDGIDLGKLLDEVQNRINAIQQFPDGAEEPIVRQPELLFPAHLQLSGVLNERAMKSLARRDATRTAGLPEVSAAEVTGAREYEISVEYRNNCCASTTSPWVMSPVSSPPRHWIFRRLGANPQRRHHIAHHGPGLCAK